MKCLTIILVQIIAFTHSIPYYRPIDSYRSDLFRPSFGGSHDVMNSLPPEIWQYYRYNNNQRQSIPQLPAPTRGIVQNIINGLSTAYEEIIRRQQQLLEAIYCTDCNTDSPWQNFLTVMAHIPGLNWIVNPSTALTTDKLHQDGTFIAATYQNGVISGIGGTLTPDNQPLVQYTFTNNHVKPVTEPTKVISTSENTMVPTTVQPSTDGPIKNITSLTI